MSDMNIIPKPQHMSICDANTSPKAMLLAVAALAALESLLSATAADSMGVGTRHNPDRELFGQGLANIAAPLFGGVPATGAIARTATNVNAGGRTPVAGIVHAIVLLLILNRMSFKEIEAKLKNRFASFL